MAHPRYVGLRLSSTTGVVPTTADMSEGELAINTADGRVYTLAGSTVIDLTDRYTVAEIDSLLAGVTDGSILADVATSGAYSDLTGRPTLGTAAPLDVPASGDAAPGEVVKGSDTRLSDARAPTAHTHPWTQVTSKPATATRWPEWSEVTGKPTLGTAAAEDVGAFDPAGAATSSMQDHEASTNPHPQYLLSDAYTAADVLAKIKSVDGPGSGLNADTLDGTSLAALESGYAGGDASTLSAAKSFATSEASAAETAARNYADTAADGALSSAKGYTDTKVAQLVDSSPGTLDTLNELAAALGDDPDFATTVSDHIGTKLDAAEYTAADVLAKVKAVDGAGSGLDADTLDGRHAGSFADASHDHPWTEVVGKPATATRWPGWGEVTGKPSTFAPSSHGHSAGEISGLSDAATTSVSAIRSGTTKGDVGLGNVSNVDSYSKVDSDSRYPIINGESSGSLSVAGSVQAARGGGSVAMGQNDGHGNANLTFNHLGGVPDISGNSGRITVNTDSSGSATMSFSLGSNTQSGQDVPLNLVFHLSESGATIQGGQVWHDGNAPTTATRWPAWGEVTGKPATFTPAPHDHDDRYVRLNNGTDTEISYTGDGGVIVRTLNNNGEYIFQARSSGQAPRFTVLHGAPELKGGPDGWTIYGEIVWHDGNAPATATRWPSFSEVTGKPAEYPAAPHAHPWSEVTGKPTTATRWPVVAEVDGLTAELAGKLDATSRYTDAEAVAAVQATPEWDALAWNEAYGWGNHALEGYLKSVSWGDVGSKPSTATRWPTFAEVTGKPSTYQPSQHSHTLSEITDAGSAAGEDASAFDAAGTATATVSNHESATDPHSQYVQKVSGKGLSTNDYTTADRNKLASVESGATADQTKADIDSLGVDADTVDGKHANDFDPAGSAAAAEQRIRDTLRQTPDPLLMHFL